MTRRSIGEAIRRARERLPGRPDMWRSHGAPASAIVEAGLRCRVTGPSGFAVVTDMPAGLGGGASSPTPGWLLRAAHAACGATVIAMRTAEEAVELSRLEVIVESESDDRGLLGIDDSAPAGPLRTLARISVAAKGVDEDRLRALVAWALEHSPVDDALRRAVPVGVEVDVAAEP